MTTRTGKECTACGHLNPAEAQFCNACGGKIEVAPQPAPEPPRLVEVSAATLLGDHAEHTGLHTTQRFYFWVFLGLAVITIVEIFLSQLGPPWFWVTALMLLSAAKFALVAMFFMHLFGDRKLYAILFFAPLFIAGAVLVSLVGLFGNF